MIRDVTIISFIFVSMIIGHVLVQNILKKNSDEIINNLENLKQQIQTGNKNDLRKNIEKIYDLWKTKSDNWSTIADHQEVDNIEKSILNIKAGIYSDDMNQIIPKIDETIFLISLIEDKEKLSLKNIL